MGHLLNVHHHNIEYGHLVLGLHVLCGTTRRRRSYKNRKERRIKVSSSEIVARGSRTRVNQKHETIICEYEIYIIIVYKHTYASNIILWRVHVYYVCVFLITRNIRCRKMRCIIYGGGGGGAVPRHVCRRKRRRRRAPGRRNRILFDRLVGIWGTVSCCSAATARTKCSFCAPPPARRSHHRRALLQCCVYHYPGRGYEVSGKWCEYAYYVYCSIYPERCVVQAVVYRYDDDGYDGTVELIMVVLQSTCTPARPTHNMYYNNNIYVYKR